MPTPARQRLSLLALLALLALPALAVGQAECLDQSHLPTPQTNGLEITASQSVTQTFTVGLTGQLTRVEIAQLQTFRGVPTAPLQFDLVVCDPQGVPTTTAPLASLALQPAQVPASRGTVSVDLRPFNVQVAAGLVLGIELSSSAAPGQQTYAWWGEAPGGSYATGQVYIRQTTALSVWDLSFSTFVAVPASAQNYGQGFPGAAGVPTLMASAPPVLGTVPQLVVGGYGFGVRTGAVYFGFDRANVATPFGGTALLQPLGNVLLFLAPGTTTQPFSIPNDPRFCGAVVVCQAVLLDAGAAQGVAFTPGLELAIGV